MSSFTYTAISNASVDKFPDNKLTRFSAELPKYIETDGWTVSLQSISLHCELQKKQKRVPYIKVHLFELEKQGVNRSYEKCLAKIPFPPDCSRVHFHHDCANPQKLALNRGQIRVLSFLITGPENEVLYLTTGEATILSLQFSKMDGEQFTITCDSHSARDMFPTNTGDDFTVGIPREMTLNSWQWEVGMQNITFPTDLADAHEGGVFIEIGGHRKSFRKFQEFTEQTLIQEIQSFILGKEELREKIYFGYLSELESKKKVHEKAYYSKVMERGPDAILLYHRSMAETTGKFDNDGVAVRISKLLCYVLGERNRPDLSDFEIRITPGQEVWFEEDIDVLSARLNNFLLYCDIIKPNIVGSGLASLMQIIPLAQTMDTCMYEPKEILFHPLAKDFFNTIRFKMRTAHGKKLCNTHKAVQITLVFRKRIIHHPLR